MEDLFKTSLMANGSSVNYHVVFENEAYIFRPDGNDTLPALTFRRQQDEWHGSENANPRLRLQAIDALERYLLKQH